MYVFILHACTKISVWLTNADRSAMFEKQNEGLIFSSSKANNKALLLMTVKLYQTMDGFGFALTGGSAEHIIHMSAPARNELLHKIFDTTGQ